MADAASMKRYWDRAAVHAPARYSATGSTGIDEALFQSGDRDLDYLLYEFAVGINSDSVVLDLGSGVGRMTRRLASRAGRVIAADVSPAMLERARQSVAADNVEYLELAGDGTVPLEDASIDLFFSAATLTHVPDRDVILRYLHEAVRLVKPGGKIVVQLRRHSGRARRTEFLANLRNSTRGVRAFSPEWRGASVPVESLLPLRRAWGQLSVLSLEPRFLWLVIDAPRGDA